MSHKDIRKPSCSDSDTVPLEGIRMCTSHRLDRRSKQLSIFIPFPLNYEQYEAKELSAGNELEPMLPAAACRSLRVLKASVFPPWIEWTHKFFHPFPSSTRTFSRYTLM